MISSRSCEEVSGHDLGWFFNQWLYRTTYPVFEMSWSNEWHDGANRLHINLKQVQEPDLTMGDAPYMAPVDFRLVGAGIDTTITAMSYSPNQNIIIPVSGTVNNVYLDPTGGCCTAWPRPRPNRSDEDLIKAPVQLHPAYPNPFNPRCLFRWEAAARTRDLVEIFDLKGHRIMSRQMDSRRARPPGIPVDRSGHQGQPAPSGTYLYRITCRGDDKECSWQLQGKVTLAR